MYYKMENNKELRNWLDVMKLVYLLVIVGFCSVEIEE